MTKSRRRCSYKSSSNKARIIPTPKPDRLYYKWKPSWNFSICDFEHEAWSLKTSKDIYSEVIDKLVSFENMRWKDIIVRDKDKNHWITCDKLSKPAQKRIRDKQWEYSELFSLRLSGKLRLFGYIENGIFNIIWYDKNHEICPSPKKHT